VVNSVNGSATRVCSAVGRHSILHQRAISRVVITGVRGSVRSGRGCVTNGRAPGARFEPGERTSLGPAGSWGPSACDAVMRQGAESPRGE
jgi:hypothetical protein